MQTLTIKDVENAFQPAKEVNDPDRFAGRSNYLEQVFYALIAEGANIAIVGNKGVGKTSLARQVQNIGFDNREIMDRIKTAAGHHFDFLVAYHACGNQTKDIDDMLAAILTREAGLGSWLYYLPKTTKMISNLTPSISAKLFGTGGDIKAGGSSETVAERVTVPTSMRGVFENVAQDILDSGVSKDGLLVIIDEFDQIQDRSGFAGFIKALATNAPGIKFCIVGVAKDIQDLMREHQSSDRLFSGSIITLEAMPDSELVEIIRIAEREINGAIKFSADATERVVMLANGHPYLVHLIGKFALRDAFLGKKTLIELSDIDAVLSSIAENQRDPVLEGRYRSAVLSSKQREGVLKSLAKHQDGHGEIFTTEAYKTALDHGIDNASHYVGQLVTDEYGAEIEKIRDRHYRFKDSLFAAYVSARPPMRGTVSDE
ncbi:ATP-binding protein [Paracoccus sanguinis]|uniref:nSTAND1 domain-containing NTPase n=1 Tax=Paracoccus sanguinis TaxID=1545044 RepID=UPI0012E004A0|nr:ATP-binding protein [Paracoccus sanguinis]